MMTSPKMSSEKEWYKGLKDGSREKLAVDRFLATGGKLNSWAYMAPELKAPYYEITKHSIKEQG